MKRSIPMVSHKHLTMILVLVVGFLISCTGVEKADEDFFAAPVFVARVDLGDGDGSLQPVRLQWFEDILYVSYRGVSRLDLFDLDLKKIGSIDLDDPIPFRPSDFRVTEDSIVLCDHATGAIVVCDRHGNYIDSYGTLPDGETALSPLSLDCYGGVAYVADIGQRRVLAISLVDAEGITERGEMILSFPPKGSDSMGFPSAVSVTSDGRLLVGDAEKGGVRVFTCDGREVYDFEAIETAQTMAPQGFALDDLIDPREQDESSFDPSGVREMGRIHLVDGLNRVIHIFDPLGRYILSYPEDSGLSGPSDIAIDRVRKRVLVADPPAGQIVVFRYKG